MVGKGTALEESLNGKRVAFTGKLLSMWRDDARVVSTQLEDRAA